MDSKRILVLVRAYGMARTRAEHENGRVMIALRCGASPSVYECATRRRTEAESYVDHLWDRIADALGVPPDCLVGLCDDDLDPDRLFGGPQGQDTD